MSARREISAFRTVSVDTADAERASTAGAPFPDAAIRVQAVGLLCPIPITRTAKAIRTLAPGSVLELRADDRVVLIDLPNWCRSWGHRYLGHREANGVLSLFVEKGWARP
jgi:tRNA 2-thiouridine synthesizing protein A